MPESADNMEREQQSRVPPRISEKRAAKLFPQHLRPFVPWRGEPESERLRLWESAFTLQGEIIPEFERLLRLKGLIIQENEKRVESGLPRVNIVGIHASSGQDTPSKALLGQLLVNPERLGIETGILSVDDKNGNLSPQKIGEIKEAVRKADGIIITTHTKRGTLNSCYMTVQEALEDLDLKGKVFYFAHTFDDPERDSQLSPEYNVYQFFHEKGCLSIPYPLYVHTEGLNETWVTRDIERSGINLIRLLQRFSGSQLQELVQHPSLAEKLKNHGDITPTWKSLRRKVERINKERKEKGEGSLTALFVLGGENPQGYSATVARDLALNFGYLGVKTEWVQLAKSYIAPSDGDPNTYLAQEIPTEYWKIRPGSAEEAFLKMLQADIIIFTAPVRFFEIAGRMQQFLERTITLENQGFLLEGKAFGTIITFGEAGALEAQARLEHYARNTGMMVIPGIILRLGMEPPENPEDIIRRKKGKKAQIRRAAAFGTALVTDILVADGKQFRWDHLNPLLPLVSAED